MRGSGESPAIKIATKSIPNTSSSMITKTSTVISTMNMNQKPNPTLQILLGREFNTTSHSPPSSFMKSKYAQSPFQ